RARVHAARLRPSLVDAVVADHRRREADELLGKARVGGDLLVPSHRRREDRFAAGEAVSADRLALEHGAVLEHKRVHSCTTAPPASVIAMRLLSARPSSQELTERDLNPSSVTRVVPFGSINTRFARSPDAMRGLRRPKMRAGPADIRSSTVGSVRIPGSTS